MNTEYCSVCECLDPNGGGSAPTSAPTPSPPSDACGSPQWFGDNYCDDDNNNEECGWDGGDCCGDDANTQYCSACECLDPNGGGSAPTPAPTIPPTPSPPSDACGSPHWFGDNYCDDDNNNEECGWDGGDCCGENPNIQFCSACECLDPNGSGPTTSAPIPTPDPTTLAPTDACGSPQWVGDNYCDDDNNNETCGWDGGDCCGTNVNTSFCSACECLDPNGDTIVECFDIWSEEKCINKKNKGKCGKNLVMQKCQKTCGYC